MTPTTPDSLTIVAACVVATHLSKPSRFKWIDNFYLASCYFVVLAAFIPTLLATLTSNAATP